MPENPTYEIRSGDSAWKGVAKLGQDPKKFDYEKITLHPKDVLEYDPKENTIKRNTGELVAALKKDITITPPIIETQVSDPLTVQKGDSITSILKKWFKNASFNAGPKNANSTDEAWHMLYPGDTLSLKSDGTWPDGSYKYIVSGRKNGKGSDILVSSKEYIFANTDGGGSTSTSNSNDASGDEIARLQKRFPNSDQPKKNETKKLSEKQENTPNTESLKNIFPTASTAELEKLASGSAVKIGKNEYQIANLSGGKAKTGEGKTFDFAKGVVAETTDIILIIKNEDGSKLAIAHQKLKSGRYSTAYRQ